MRGVDQKWALKEEQNQATDCGPQTAGATNCTLEKSDWPFRTSRGELSVLKSQLLNFTELPTSC